MTRILKEKDKEKNKRIRDALAYESKIMKYTAKDDTYRPVDVTRGLHTKRGMRRANKCLK